MAATRPTPIRSKRKARLALFDAQSLVAKGVKEQLVGRSFPVESVRLYTSSQDPEANLSEFRGEAMLVAQPDFDTLGALDIAFFCGTRPEGALYLDWPGRKGFVAIDLTSASREAADVPLVNAAVNPEAIPDRPGVIGSPHPIALMLSTVLAAVGRGPGLEEASVVVHQPASESGDDGIAELYQQTLSLMNFKDLPHEVFGRQIAFNLVPDFAYAGSVVPGGAAAANLEREVFQITGARFGLSIAIVLAPVFHCHTAVARVVLPAGCGRDSLEEALRAAPGLRLAGKDEAATPIERAGQPDVTVAGLRPAGAESSFWIWIVSDNLQSGTALNAVRIAESLWSRNAGHSRSGP